MTPFKLLRLAVFIVFPLVCSVGCLASMAPGEGEPYHRNWLIFYGTTGVLALAGLVVAVFRKPSR